MRGATSEKKTRKALIKWLNSRLDYATAPCRLQHVGLVADRLQNQLIRGKTPVTGIKVDASRRAEKCRSLRVQVEVGVSGCALRGRPALKTRPRHPPAPGSLPPQAPFRPRLPAPEAPSRPRLPPARGSLPPQAPSRPRLPSAPDTLPPQTPSLPNRGLPSGPLRVPSTPGSLPPQAPWRPNLPTETPFKFRPRLLGAPSTLAPRSCPPQPPFRPRLPSAPYSLPPRTPFRPMLPQASASGYAAASLPPQHALRACVRALGVSEF